MEQVGGGQRLGRAGIGDGVNGRHDPPAPGDAGPDPVTQAVPVLEHHPRRPLPPSADSGGEHPPPPVEELHHLPPPPPTAPRRRAAPEGPLPYPTPPPPRPAPPPPR